MLTQESKTVKELFRDIRRHLPIGGKFKKEYLQHLRNDIGIFCEKVPQPTTEELYEAAGTPDEIAENYLSAVDVEEMKRAILLRWILIAAAGLAVLAAVAVLIIMLTQQQTGHGYMMFS